MLDQVVFQEYWGGIKVSAYTDRYAYDPSDDSLLFISLAGTEQAVKAVSSALIGHRIVSIKRQGNREIQVHGSPAGHFRVFSTKLPSGAVHQLVADTRFFGNDTHGALRPHSSRRGLVHGRLFSGAQPFGLSTDSRMGSVDMRAAQGTGTHTGDGRNSESGESPDRRGNRG